MMNHDMFRDKAVNKELIEKLSPKFNELTQDVQQIMEYSSNPLVIAVLLFKLAEERKKTNELMEKIYQKYDNIMLHLKTQGTSQLQPAEKKVEILPPQDQKILDLAQINGNTTAEEVQKALNYKGKNAASQRLNKLCQGGYLKKVRSGKTVLYLP